MKRRSAVGIVHGALAPHIAGSRTPHRACVAVLVAAVALGLAGCGATSLLNGSGGAQGEPRSTADRSAREDAAPAAERTAPARVMNAPAAPGAAAGPDTGSLPPVFSEPSPDIAASLESGGGRAPPASVGRDGMVRIGLLLPLSGTNAAVGRALMQAAEMALYDLADDRFLLMPFDTRGTPNGAAEAAAQATEAGVSLVLGPIFSTSVAAATPLTLAAGVNIVGFSNNRVVAGPGAYLIGLLPEEQVRRVVSYAVAGGLYRIAALTPETAYGELVLQAVQKTLERYGGTLTRIQTYQQDEKSITAAIRRLVDYDPRRDRAARAGRKLPARDYGFDAVVVAEQGTRLKSVVAQMQYYDLDTDKVRLLGLASWADPELGREPGLRGAWFAGPSRRALLDFERRYAETYGDPPPDLAALGYDAAALAAVLAQAESGPQFRRDDLESPRGFAGRAGLFRFLPDGSTERGLAVYEITARGPRVVSPAPVSFDDAVN